MQMLLVDLRGICTANSAMKFGLVIDYTLPEANIAPQNGCLEDYFPFGARPIFRGEMLVSGRVMTSFSSWL